jgi:hypothetical protein
LLSTNRWNWSSDVIDVAAFEGRETFKAVGDFGAKASNLKSNCVSELDSNLRNFRNQQSVHLSNCSEGH